MAHVDQLADEVRRIVDDLDRLLAERSQGRLSHRHVEQVEEAAAQLRQAARGPVRPVNPPLGRTAKGDWIW